MRCFLPRGAAIEPGEKLDCSLVIGFVRPGQLRRDFLAYLERERAHPYRPFLHYNSWYDIGYFNKYDEAAALNVIHAFGEELSVKRGVKLDSFMFDDGWDNNKTLWHFHSGFPNGFAPLQQAAAQYGAAPGIWLSPWGGYGQPHEDRIKFGKEQGFETRDGNFSLAGPKYYERFRDLCVEVVQKYGINQFKFDGIGVDGTDSTGAAPTRFRRHAQVDRRTALAQAGHLHQPDHRHLAVAVLAAVRRLDLARRRRPFDFVNGTAPERERWISYKDNDVHDEVVGRSDLYPLNSLDAARHHLRQESARLELRHQQHPQVGNPRLVRQRHPIAGNVHHAQPDDAGKLGRHWPKPPNGRARTPTRSWTRIGSEARR